MLQPGAGSIMLTVTVSRLVALVTNLHYIHSLHSYLYVIFQLALQSWNYLVTYKPLSSMLYLVTFTLLDTKLLLYIYKTHTDTRVYVSKW